MELDLKDWALVLAGVIGGGVAIIHGVLVQRLVVKAYDRAAGDKVFPASRRLLAPLIQFSTYNWFLGGVALVVAAIALGPPARLAVALLVGSSYLFGALGNLWATRGRHPGWALYAAALVLIGYGV
jgi:hypothetical protein